MRSKLFIHIFILLLLASCKGKEEPLPNIPAATGAPQITINSPGNNTHYNENDVISISATISDDKQVYISFVQIKDLSDNSLLYDSGEIHNHPQSFTQTSSYTVTKSATANYLIIIKTSDFDGNQVEKTVQVSVN